MDSSRLLHLVRSRAYTHSQTGFRLSSGKTSHHYVDAKSVLCDPEGLRLFAEWGLEVIEGTGIQAVGGPELGSVIPSAAISVLSWETNPVYNFIVRREKKIHGLGRKVEGILPPKSRVAIVEDVLTTGQSALRAIQEIEALDCQVVVVLALVDRKEGSEGLLRDYLVVPFCTLDDLVGSEK